MTAGIKHDSKGIWENVYAEIYFSMDYGFDGKLSLL